MAATGVIDAVLNETIARERWKLQHPHLARIFRIARRAARRLVPGVMSRSLVPRA